MSSLPPFASLVRTVAPTETPVSVAECKEHMRVTSSSEDTLIEEMLNAAVAMTDAQGALGRAMVTQTWRQYVGNAPGEVMLAMTPVGSVSAIGYIDTDGATQSANVSDFDVIGTNQATMVSPKAGASWPTADDRADAIWVDYTAGYGGAADVPATLKQAVKMLVAHWYGQRETAAADAMQTVPHGYDALVGVERASWYG